MISGKIIKEKKINKKRIIFRYPKIEDIEHLKNFHNSLIKERAYIEFQKKVSSRFQFEWLFQLIIKMEKREAILVILEVENEIKGYALIERFGLNPPAFHIGELNLYLAKDVRRQGYGTQLFLTAIKEVKKLLKIKIIFIDVAKNNKPSLEFFNKVGFKVIGKIKRGFKYYGRYLDDIILVKYL